MTEPTLSELADEADSIESETWIEAKCRKYAAALRAAEAVVEAYRARDASLIGTIARDKAQRRLNEALARYLTATPQTCEPTLSELADWLDRHAAQLREQEARSRKAHSLGAVDYLVAYNAEIERYEQAAAALREPGKEIARLKDMAADLDGYRRKYEDAHARLNQSMLKRDELEAALAEMRRDFADIAAMEGAEGMTDAKFAEIALGIANAALSHLPATPQTGNEDYENRPGYLRQIADEIDAEAEVSPCTEASIIREAAEEIERLRTTLDEAEQALTFYRKMRATPPKEGE